MRRQMARYQLSDIDVSQFASVRGYSSQAAVQCLKARARGAHREVDKCAARVQARMVVQQLDVARLQEVVQAQLVRPRQPADLCIR